MQKVIGMQFSLFDSYLDPFCFSALVLPFWALERKWLFHQSNISELEAGVLILVLILFSEVILPNFSSLFVYDLWDVILIVGGGVWWYLFHPKLVEGEL